VVPWFAIAKITRIEGDVTIWSQPARGDPGTEELDWYLDDPRDAYKAFLEAGEEYVPPRTQCQHCAHLNVIGTRYCFRCGVSLAQKDFDPASAEERMTYAREVLGLIGSDLIILAPGRRRPGRGQMSDRMTARNLDKHCRKSGKKYVREKRGGQSYGDDMITRLIHDGTWRRQMLLHVGNEFAVIGRAAALVQKYMDDQLNFQVVHDRTMEDIGELLVEPGQAPIPAAGKKEAIRRMIELDRCWGPSWQLYLPEDSPEKGAWLKGRGKGRGKGKR
jgi:hypothetical protein